MHNALQHGESQRKNNGTGAPECVLIVDCDLGGWTDTCSERSSRFLVGAREPQGLAT
jgi:hypothetical protein